MPTTGVTQWTWAVSNLGFIYIYHIDDFHNCYVRVNERGNFNHHVNELRLLQMCVGYQQWIIYMGYGSTSCMHQYQILKNKWARWLVQNSPNEKLQHSHPVTTGVRVSGLVFISFTPSSTRKRHFTEIILDTYWQYEAVGKTRPPNQGWHCLRENC